MTLELAIRTGHFIAILCLLGTLAMQNVLLSQPVRQQLWRQLARLDSAYGLSAALVFLTGLTLWLGVGKPAEFYSENIVFMVKFSAFIVIGLVSVIPTVFLLKQRKTSKWSTMPPWLVFTKRFELIALVLLPALAVPMARGVGLVS